jgi:hypothetical protein
MTNGTEGKASDDGVLVWNGMIASVPGRPVPDARKAEAEETSGREADAAPEPLAAVCAEE